MLEKRNRCESSNFDSIEVRKILRDKTGAGQWAPESLSVTTRWLDSRGYYSTVSTQPGKIQTVTGHHPTNKKISVVGLTI